MAEPDIPPPLGAEEIPPPLSASTEIPPPLPPVTYRVVHDAQGGIHFVPEGGIDLTGARYGGGKRYDESAIETVGHEFGVPRGGLGNPSATGVSIAEHAKGLGLTAAALPGFMAGGAIAGPAGAGLGAPLLPALISGSEAAIKGGNAMEAAKSAYTGMLPMSAAMAVAPPLAGALAGPAAETGALIGLPLVPAAIERRLPTPEEFAFSAIPIAAKMPELAARGREVGIERVADQFIEGGLVTPDVVARTLAAQANPVPPPEITPREALPPPTPEPFSTYKPRVEIPPERRAQIAQQANPEGIRYLVDRLSSEGQTAKEILYSPEFKVETQLMRAEDAPARRIILADILPAEKMKGLEELPVTTTEPVSAEAGSVPLGVATAGVAPFIERDIAPRIKAFASGVRDTGAGILDLVSPKTGVPRPALDAVYKMLGGRNKAAYVVDAGFKAARDRFDTLSPAEQTAFVDRYKQGQSQPQPWMAATDAAMRAIDKASWDQADALGASPAWKENHFRVLWKTLPGAEGAPAERSSAFSRISRRPLRGSRGQFKRSTLDTMSEGIARGGVPIDPNPVRLFQLAQADMMKFVTAQRMFDWAKRNGMAKFAKTPADAPEGFVPLNDRIAKVYFKVPQGMVQAGEYYVEPGFGRLLNNHLSSDMIRETALGRGLMQAKMLSTQVELGLSGFHAVFETLESVGSQLGQGMRRTWNLGVARGIKPGEIAGGLKDMLAAPVSPAGTARLGGSALKYAANPEEFLKLSRGKDFIKQFPQAQSLIDDLFTGGGALGMHDDYRLNTYRAMKQEFHAANPIGAMARLPFAINEVALHPLFETYIPRLKVGTFLKEYSLRLKEYAPDLESGRVTRPELARDTWHFVEDRFGEMNFDSLFWNRTFKTALQMAFRSITWKLGNLRAFGKTGPLQAREVYRAAKEGRVPRIEQGTGWLLGMSMLTTALGSVISKTQSGKYPWEWADGHTTGGMVKNVVFPHYDPHDPDKRMATPTYWKDMFHLIHGPGSYIKSSMSGFASKTFEDWENRDFYNTQVYNPNDSVMKQGVDALAHLMPVPFSVSSALRLRGEGQPARLQVMSFLGFNKAPKWASQSPFEQSVSESLAKDPGPVRTKEQFALAADRRQVIEALREKRQVPADAVKFAKENGLNPQQTRNMIERAHEDPRVTAIKKLGLAEALDAWDLATPEEQAAVEIAMKRKAVAYAHAHGIKDPLFARAKAAGLLP